MGTGTRPRGNDRRPRLGQGGSELTGRPGSLHWLFAAILDHVDHSLWFLCDLELHPSLLGLCYWAPSRHHETLKSVRKMGLDPSPDTTPEAGILSLISQGLGFLIWKLRGPCSWHGDRKKPLFSLFKGLMRGPSGPARRASSKLRDSKASKGSKYDLTWQKPTRVSLPGAKWLQARPVQRSPLDSCSFSTEAIAKGQVPDLGLGPLLTSLIPVTAEVFPDRTGVESSHDGRRCAQSCAQHP